MRRFLSLAQMPLGLPSRRKAQGLLSLAVLFILSGCASPLNQGAYTPIIDLPPIQPVSEGREPVVIKYDNIPTLDQRVKKYVGEGWVVIGGASWVCTDDGFGQVSNAIAPKLILR